MGILLYHIEHVNWPCKGNERKSTCSGGTGGPGQFPAPSPLLRYAEPVWGGGGMAGRVLPGNPERGRGVTLASQYRELESHLILARKIRGLESHLSSASYFGKPFKHLNLAGFCCKWIWQIIQRVFKDEIKAKKREVNCVLFRRPVMSHHRHCI